MWTNLEYNNLFIFQKSILEVIDVNYYWCCTHGFVGHAGTCTKTDTLTKVLEGAWSDRQTN